MVDSTLIEAAGALLWRPAQRGAEIALVHRPRYDDWSLPKGKLDPGEHAFAGALREVTEETGATGALGRSLGEVRYRVNGDPKRVRYWALRHLGGTFTPGDEVDSVEWLAPRAARRRMSLAHDVPILDRWLADPRPTWPLIVVRHASAGRRSAWKGPDQERPLDKRGQRQSEALVELLCAYQPAVAICAPVLRCRQTLDPFLAAAGLGAQDEPLFSEDGYRAEPDAAARRLVELAAAGTPTVICSQGKSIPGLLRALTAELDRPLRAEPTVRKGGLWLAHLAWGADALPDLVGLDRHPPLG